MNDRTVYITLTPAELDSLIERAVAKGIRAAQEPFISQRRAEKIYGRAVIANLIEQGLIQGHRQGAAANAKIVFERDAIERAIVIG